jgi:hypothetical protein
MLALHTNSFLLVFLCWLMEYARLALIILIVCCTHSLLHAQQDALTHNKNSFMCYCFSVGFQLFPLKEELFGFHAYEPDGNVTGCNIWFCVQGWNNVGSDIKQKVQKSFDCCGFDEESKNESILITTSIPQDKCEVINCWHHNLSCMIKVMMMETSFPFLSDNISNVFLPF